MSSRRVLLEIHLRGSVVPISCEFSDRQLASKAMDNIGTDGAKLRAWRSFEDIDGSDVYFRADEVVMMRLLSSADSESTNND